MSELTWEMLAQSLASADKQEDKTPDQTTPPAETPPQPTPSPQTLTPEQRLTLLEMQLAIERVAKKYNIPQDELIKAAQDSTSPIERIALQVIGKRALEQAQNAPEAPPEGGGKSSSPTTPEDEEARLLLEAHRKGLGVNTS